MSYAGSPQKTVVLEGVGSITEALQGLYSRVRNRCDRYEITSGIPLMTQSNKIKELLINLRKRGVRIRQITEITKDNVFYCKQAMEIVELRHLEHVRGGMDVNDDEFMVTGNPEDPQTIAYLSKDTGSSTRTNTTSSPQVIYSNIKQLVEQQQSIFDLLWSKAIPAEQRIKEIEEGVVPYKTKVIDNSEEIIQEIGRLASDSNELATCLTAGGILYSHYYFFNIKKKLLDKQRKGEHMGIRYVTSIEKENLEIAKLYLDNGIQIKHFSTLPPMSFILSVHSLQYIERDTHQGWLAVVEHLSLWVTSYNGLWYGFPPNALPLLIAVITYDCLLFPVRSVILMS